MYGITSAQRVASLPDVPTLQEQGLKGADVGIWHGLYAPKGTPKPVLDKLVSSLQTALADADVQKRFADLGAVTYGPDKQTPAALRRLPRRPESRSGLQQLRKLVGTLTGTALKPRRSS